MAQTFPFYLPTKARRLFTSEALVRRLVSTTRWSSTSRVLEIFGSAAGIDVAKATGCKVDLVDTDSTALKQLEPDVLASGLQNRISFSHLEKSLPYPEGTFDGALVLGRIWAGLQETARQIRPILGLRGRLVMSWPMRVGVRPSSQAVSYWEQLLGVPLKNPRESLMVVEAEGYEPESIETSSEWEIDEFYRTLEAALPEVPEEHRKALKEECELHRATGGKGGVALGLIVARRKEPGERPPPAGDSG